MIMPEIRFAFENDHSGAHVGTGLEKVQREVGRRA